jgi:Rieske Fe-S protein
MTRRRTGWLLLLGLLLATLAGTVATSVLAAPPGPTRMAVNTRGLPAVTMHQIPTPICDAMPGTWNKPNMILLARDGSTWRAFSNRSTHRGEPVIWREDLGRFYDIYSAAMWDTAGRPVAGPAPRGLDTYQVTRDGDYVIIDLSKPGPTQSPP